MALALESKAMADDIMLGDTPKAVKRRKRVEGIDTTGRLWKHSTLRDIEGLVTADEISEAFVFTMVRNPWDRLVSYYHWLKAQSFDHVAVTAAQTLPFSEFLRNPLVAGGLRTATFGSYVIAPDGAEQCDMFVRLEHLDEDLPKLEDALGLKLGAFPSENASTRPDVRDIYSAADRDFVAELCAQDIARFDYRF